MATAPLFSIAPFKALAPALRPTPVGPSPAGGEGGFSGSLGRALGAGLGADRIAAASELLLSQGLMDILGEGESGESGGSGGGGIGGLNGLLLTSLLGGQGGLAGGLAGGLPGDLGALIKSYPGGVEGLVTALRQVAAASPEASSAPAAAFPAAEALAPAASPILPAALEPALAAAPAGGAADPPGLVRSSGLRAYGRTARHAGPPEAAAPGRPGALAGREPVSNLPGRISARFESGGDPAAIGYDRVGGTSYGIYQLSSRAGTMDQFLGFLELRQPEWAARLEAAGPANTGSAAGAMPDAWRAVAAADPEDFARLQHEFVGQRHFLPAAQRIRESTGLDLAGNPALAEVLWSTAVQHGPSGAASIVRGAAEAAGPAGSPGFAQSLVGEIYRRRAGQFGSSEASVQEAVRSRLRQERDLALSLLRAGGMLDSEV